ncbi:hypothetical protein [Herpetosiphon giganteus]|uniref:hypothetical protein n=1 Tax=Herpetosiphon giganteus TaxID=2029754 RepID=UPI001959247D|nr:hypothetical protein [Herpetosiphon giganteus]MBM7846293.1 hypothetical protein [Herpetosiphon giganteus]
MKTRWNAVIGMLVLLVLVGCSTTTERVVGDTLPANPTPSDIPPPTFTPTVVYEPHADPALPVVLEEAMVDDHAYGIYAWDGGLQIVLIYTGLATDPTCERAPANGPSGEAHRCSVVFTNGRTTRWSLITTDGTTGMLLVNETLYQLPHDATMLWIKPNGEGLVMTSSQKIVPSLTTGDAPTTLGQWMASDPELATWAEAFRTP